MSGKGSNRRGRTRKAIHMEQHAQAEVASMNADYVIYVATKRGRRWRYVKDDGAWTQTAPTGRVRKLSAEQLLSHLLPPLSGDQSNLTVRVVRRIRNM
jgi:hypothetical protein